MYLNKGTKYNSDLDKNSNSEKQIKSAIKYLQRQMEIWFMKDKLEAWKYKNDCDQEMQ